MAYRQNKPENLITGGGSLYNNSQAPKRDLQYQNQLQKELKQFIIKIIDQKFDEFKQELKQEVKEMVRDVEGSFQEKINKGQKDLITVTDGLSEVICKIDKNAVENELEFQSGINLMDQKIYSVQNKLQELENQVLMTQMRLKESALRLRGIDESISVKDLRKVCAGSLAGILKIKPDEISCKIEQVYRVNSHVATEKKLPRDVVVYLTEKKLRDDILQKSFVSAPQTGGKKIAVFKELPSKILKDRKNFGFLVTELKKKQIPFRWNLPAGIIFWFQGKRYQLNTVEKAEEFYDNMFSSVSKSLNTTVQDTKQHPKQDFAVSTTQVEEDLMERQQEVQSATQQKYEEQQSQGFKPPQAKNKKWKRSHNSKKNFF